MPRKLYGIYRTGTNFKGEADGTQVLGNFLGSNKAWLRDVILPLDDGVMVRVADDDERLQEEWQSDNSATTFQLTFGYKANDGSG